MVDFLTQNSARYTPRLPKSTWTTFNTMPMSAIRFSNRATEWIFLRVDLDKLPGVGRGKKLLEGPNSASRIND